MSLTRKHFVALAGIITDVRGRISQESSTAPDDVLNAVALELAGYLRQGNPRFDRLRFLHAAGVVDHG